MKRFIEGEDRNHSCLAATRPTWTIMWPQDNPVRVVEAFVRATRPAATRFEGAAPAATGTFRLSTGGAAQLYVYGLPEPHPVEPAAACAWL